MAKPDQKARLGPRPCAAPMIATTSRPTAPVIRTAAHSREGRNKAAQPIDANSTTAIRPAIETRERLMAASVSGHLGTSPNSLDGSGAVSVPDRQDRAGGLADDPLGDR